MSRNPNLNGFIYFETVARRGTISRAAEEMAVSPSAVSQQIKLLEQQLGVKLFRREGRLLSLTLEGEQLFQTSSTALRTLRDAQRRFRKSRETYELNMRVTPSLGVRWLGPRLSDFVTRHPDWDLHVDAAPDPTDFNREIMELDIRYGSGSWPGYHVQPILSDLVLPLASPKYLEQFDRQISPENLLSKARLIGSSRALCQWDFWLPHFKIEAEKNRQSILMDRSSMAIQLAAGGSGIILESIALAMPELADGQLVPVFPQIPLLRFPAYWAICPQRYKSRKAIQIFLDWIDGQVREFEKDVDLLVTKNSLKIEDIDFGLDNQNA